MIKLCRRGSALGKSLRLANTTTNRSHRNTEAMIVVVVNIVIAPHASLPKKATVLINNVFNCFNLIEYPGNDSNVEGLTLPNTI